MTSTELQVIAAWLDEKGFKEAATRLLEATDEVAQRVHQDEDVEWVYYQH